MAHLLQTIKKRSTFLMIQKSGKISFGKAFNVQFFGDNTLNNTIFVGFTATKKIGKAVKRNKAKRIMRQLSRKVISKYGKKNSYYVLIAKSSIFEIPFHSQEIELKKIIS